MKNVLILLALMEQQGNIMIFELMDEQLEEFILQWLRQQKKWTEETLTENDYWHPDDRLNDEEYLRALNIMIKNHEANYED